MVDLTAKLRELDNLPALPASLGRLLQALNDDSADVAELEEIVRGDEAVSAGVLRFANSASMGAVDRTFTLAESLARIGQRNLRRIAVSLQASKVVANRGENYGHERNDLWRCSMAGALAGEWLGRSSGLEDPGMCFVAALLRDVGKIASDCLFEREQVVEACEKGPEMGGQLVAEREILGVDHAELGAQLAEVWRLPPRLVLAIRHHHGGCDEEDEVDPLPHIVHCADMIAVNLGASSGMDGASYAWDLRSIEIVGLDRPKVESCMSDVAVELERLLTELGTE